MPAFTATETANIPTPNNFPKLREEVLAAFAPRAIDANETGDGATITAYLTSSQPGDNALLAATCAAHNAASKTSEQLAAEQVAQDRADAILADMTAEIRAAQKAVDNWAGLSAAQKDAALKRTIQALVVVFKVIRFVLHRLT